MGGVREDQRYAMKIKLSRHARNNARLYKIFETDIIETIELPDLSDIEGNKIIAVKKFPGRFSGYSLKVVYEEIDKEIFMSPL